MTIDEIFFEATQKNASDVHLVVGHHPLFRINGDLFALKKFSALDPDALEGLVGSILSREQKERFLQDRELDVSYMLTRNNTRFRINLHFERGNMGLAARVIPSEVPTIESLEMPEVVYDLISLDQGLILVTGPTGCGKSTSLAAMIEYINSERSAHIITLEDPIEFLHTSKKSVIEQRQYGTDFLNFSDALKHILRQDPDVIMVGEMRDLETVAATITLAETGHLVLATLHTATAAQTIDRIIDIFPPHQQNQVRLQLSLSLRGVISQRLLPREENGLVAAREILVNTHAVGNVIRENKIQQIPAIIQTSAKDGMQNLQQDLKRLVNEKKISKEVFEEYMKSLSLLAD